MTKGIAKLLNTAVIIAVFTVVFIILIEDFSWTTAFLGVLVSGAAIILTNRFLLKEDYQSLFSFNILGFLVYFIILFYYVIISGLHSAYLTIYGKVNLCEITYKSSIKSDFGLTLLANSITMTPGTVTVSMKENELFIMQLCKANESADTSDITKLEENIKRFVINKEQ